MIVCERVTVGETNVSISRKYEPSNEGTFEFAKVTDTSAGPLSTVVAQGFNVPSLNPPFASRFGLQDALELGVAEDDTVEDVNEVSNVVKELEKSDVDDDADDSIVDELELSEETETLEEEDATEEDSVIEELLLDEEVATSVETELVDAEYASEDDCDVSVDEDMYEELIDAAVELETDD